MRPKKNHFIPFNFVRTDAQGQKVKKAGFIREDAIDAIEPGTDEEVTHLHLKSGAHLVVADIGACGEFLPQSE